MDSSERNYTVYTHTVPGGKKYIGITRTPVVVRWGAAGNKYKLCKYFFRAITKYGWENITHEIVFTGLTATEAKQAEKDLISEHRTRDPLFGYNMTDGGDGVRGYKPTNETRMKLSAALVGNKRRLGTKHTDEEKARLRAAMMGNQHLLGHRHTDETKAKMSAAHKGRIVTAETRAKLSAKSMGNKSNSGREHTAETKAKMSAAKSGKEITSEHRANIRDANILRAKGIERLTMCGDVVVRYVSIGDAIGETGISKSSLWRACSGKQATAGGFCWRYV